LLKKEKQVFKQEGGGKQQLLSVQRASHKLLIQGVIDDVYPGAAFGMSGIFRGQRQSFTTMAGRARQIPFSVDIRRNTVFDLASLTKPLATVLAALCLLQKKKIALDEPLSSLVERKVGRDKEKIRLWHLLAHASGLPAHREYFREMMARPGQDKKECLVEWILQEKLQYKPGIKTLYSDLGFMLLGRIIEIKSQQPLHVFVEKQVFMPLGLKGLFFIPLREQFKGWEKIQSIFAATEKSEWRQRILCGEVHDDNAFALGGVAGHAGLFGDIRSVLRLTTHLLDIWLGKAEHPNFSGADLRKLFVRQKIDRGNTWALGFDTPAAAGSSSGRYLSPTSVGHLGFTGTSFWLDREREMVVVLLTNRVHPSKDNEKIRAFRPYFHDGVLKKYLQQCGGN
jgi:CubicO group peptidase (beta-lactamase class C family)